MLRDSGLFSVKLMCLLLTTVLLTSIVSISWAENGETQVDKATRKADALKIIDDLERLYVFFDVKGIRKDWLSRKKDWAKRAEKLEDDVQLIQLVLECIDCLRDGHMHFSKLNVKLPEPTPKFCSGLYFGELDEKKVCLVTDMSSKYSAAKPGAVVYKIDGKDARKWLDEKSQELWDKGGSFSSPQRAALMVWRWGLMGDENETHKITVGVGSRKEEFTARNMYPCRMYPETQPKIPDLIQSDKDRDVRYKALGDGIVYIYVRGLSGSTDPAIGAILASMQDTKGVVIDISDNGGGGGYKLDSLMPFKGKIATLISERCFSAGETYARDLVKACDARLFGSQTAGSSSEKKEYALPRDLGSITYSSRSRTGITRQIEFFGIEPHERVYFDAADLENGESTLVRKAVEWLKNSRK